jgi:hypothetical protein
MQCGEGLSFSLSISSALFLHGYPETKSTVGIDQMGNCPSDLRSLDHTKRLTLDSVWFQSDPLLVSTLNGRVVGSATICLAYLRLTLPKG